MINETHYVATIKIEKVVKGTRPVEVVYRDSGRTAGPNKAEEFREVSTVMNVNVTDQSLDRLVEKSKGHLGLVDDNQMVFIPNTNEIARRPIRDNPQA
jgi:hypothetical protein